LRKLGIKKLETGNLKLVSEGSTVKYPVSPLGGIFDKHQVSSIKYL
jgi:hypothetical protein